MASRGQADSSARALYSPSETYLSLVEGNNGPFRSSTRQLAVSTLCTNRALPLQMSVGKGDSDFTEKSGAPIESIRCVAGPTPPRESPVRGELAWALLSHLNLDYVGLLQRGPGNGALREMLSLYAGFTDRTNRRQIEGVTGIESKPVVRPLPFPGPITFGRGVEITLTCDEHSFEGSGVFVFGAVMERFFAKYTSINSFTQTVLRTSQRGEVMRWPTTAGRRSIL